MAVQIYTFKITYADCDNKIWRIAAVSSNYTLAKLGYMILASFDTMAYHLFEMKFKGTTYFLTEEDFEDLPNYDNERYDLSGVHKIGTLGLNVGDTIQMTYDLGCCQVFNIELLEINDMLRGHGTAYPKILDGAGRGTRIQILLSSPIFLTTRYVGIRPPTKNMLIIRHCRQKCCFVV